MGFFAPWFLAGLAAISLPVWLHLLRQFKRTPRPFSSLMFFERRVQSSTKHRRLRHLALLALRIALLALLVLAFANPFINIRSNAASRRTLTIIAVDRSFSMHGADRMTAAKAEAHRLADDGNSGRQIELLAFDAHVEVLVQPQRGNAVNAAIDSLQAGDEVSSYGELCHALLLLAQTSGMHLDAHVITDVQQTSMPAAFADLQVGPEVTLTVHSIVRNDIANYAVESVNVPPRLYNSEPARVTAIIRSWNAASATRTVSLRLDNRLVASKDVTVPAMGRTQVEFNAFEVPHGLNRGDIRIEPHDQLPQDDVLVFSVEKSDARTVLFLYSGGRSRESFYYKVALESSKATGLVVEAAPVEELLRKDLAKYAFVVLNDLPKLEDSAAKKLDGYIANGGAALVTVGPRSAREHSVAFPENRVDMTTDTQGAGSLDSGSSAMNGAGRFDNVQFLQTAHIRPKANDRVLARFADGSPLLLEEHSGEGRILIFASTLDNSTSDFPLHTAFLPFVAHTGTYLSGASDDGSSVVVGAPVILRRSNTQNTAADVIGPDGTHLLDLNEATRAMSFDVTREGFYEVQRANGLRTIVAVHADRRESDLTVISAETLKLWSHTGASATPAKITGTGSEVSSRSLWRYVLTLALLAAFVESMFGMRYLTDERQTG